MRKILSLLLAVCMAYNVMTPVAYAAQDLTAVPAAAVAAATPETAQPPAGSTPETEETETDTVPDATPPAATATPAATPAPTAAPTTAPTATPVATPILMEKVEPEAPRAAAVQSGDFYYTVSSSDNMATITAYVGAELEVQVPAALDGYTVKGVGNKAFAGNVNVRTVRFADSITSIGSNCFDDCPLLTNVTLPADLDTIGNYAFNDCPMLVNIVIPAKLRRVNGVGGVFRGTTGLKNVSFAEGTTKIVATLFQNCTSLESIHIPEGVTTIQANAFNGASNLKTVSLPQSLTDINSSAFYGCTSLQALDLPDALTSIGDSAFRFCTALSDVTLPANLETLAAAAFGDCPQLTSINIPKSLRGTSGLNGPFLGETNLKNVTFEEGTTAIVANLFRDCEGLESITIPEGVTTIQANAFNGAVSLKTVSLPQSLTAINSNAFYGCTSLEGPLDLPDGVTDLGEYCFRNCTELNGVTLPANLRQIGGGAFLDCSSLTSINIPKTLENVQGSASVFEGSKLREVSFDEGVTIIPNRLFADCTELERISLPGTLVEIRSDAFARCTSLTNAVLPSGTTFVGSGAFSGCTALHWAYVPITIDRTLKDVFTDCPDLTIISSERSMGAVYAIENDIPLRLLPTYTWDSRELNQVYEETGLTANTSNAMSKGYITVNIDYSFKDEPDYVYSTISDIKVRIPENCEYVASSVVHNGEPDLRAGYNADTRILTIGCDGQKGNISFTVRPTSAGKLAMAAYISYFDGQNTWEEALGFLNEEIEALTVQASDTVDKVFTVSGIGPADTAVSIYLDGELLGQTQTNKAGNYTYVVVLTDPEDMVGYTVTASAMDGETPCEASCTVYYQAQRPRLTKCLLTYRGQTYDLLDAEQGRLVLTFMDQDAGNLENLHFELDYDQRDRIEKVSVESSRGGVIHRMYAVWDEQAQAYVAEGTFDNTVPGKIFTGYKFKGSTLSVAQGIDYSSSQYVNTTTPPMIELGEDIKSGAATVSDSGWQNIAEPAARSADPFTAALTQQRDLALNLPAGREDIGGTLKYIIKRGEVPFADESTARAQLEACGFTSYVDENGDEVFTRFASQVQDAGADVTEKAKNYVLGEIVDLTSGEIQQVAVNADGVTLADEVETLEGIAETFGFTDDLITWDNGRVALDEARDQVLASARTNAEKTAVLEVLENAQDANRAAAAATVLNVGISMASVDMPQPAGLALALYTMHQQASVEQALGEDSGCLGMTEVLLRDISWIIDPAGYVYDAATKEALQGVTTTAYWIELDPEATAEEYEAFWATPPAEDEYGTLWQAEEWGQKNPLQTDQDGYYQWDVPEGWWRVQYEKEGYETAWSDWLPVPPPQTDVNIALKPEGFSGVITSDTYEIVDGLLYLSAETTADTLLNGLVGTDIGIAAADGAALTGTALVGTGATLAQGGQEAELTVVFYGDLTGDGKISSSDMLEMQRAILGISKLEGVRLKAATPRSGDSEKPQTTDMLQMRRVLLGIKFTMLD